MKVLNISKKQFSTLEKYTLPKEVTNTECELFIVNDRVKWERKRLLLKKLYIDEGEYFGNKLMTINTLINSREELGIERLVLPEKLAVVNKKVVGFTMPLIENSTNLLSMLRSYDVSNEEKIGYLKQVGLVLKHIESVEQTLKGFFLGDVHEGNFIVDDETKTVRAVDLDSCKTENNHPFASKYLATNPNLQMLPQKYPKNAKGIGIPNANTDLLCYNMMVLNYISHGPIYNMPLEEFYMYLQHLCDEGFPNELLDCFCRLYSYADNYSSMDLLDQIPTNLNRVNYSVFKYKTRKR
ncbi:MAG: hypothetical protein PHD78_03410 [Bacilli bacterium]|nr:hypothetical protein [Bacilli bacterium]MDD4411041.1 hypothetical protein [Bacilli bacterium]